MPVRRHGKMRDSQSVCFRRSAPGLYSSFANSPGQGWPTFVRALARLPSHGREIHSGIEVPIRPILGELVPKGTSLERSFLKVGPRKSCNPRGIWPYEEMAKVWRIVCISDRRIQTAVLAERSERENQMVNLEEIKITPRDEEVLQLLVQGCSNKEIALQLRISPRTVKQHLRTLFLRAGIRDGRKRVKLATAMFQKERKQVCSPATV